MAAIIDSEYSISSTGDIRATSPISNHTVLELYEWIRSKGSDLVATGDDLFDITDPDIAEKKFETIINLLGTTNIDYATSKTLYGGSIVQADGVIYDGISVIAPAGTEVDIIQNGAKLPNFWGTGYNADPTKGISHKFLIQVADTNGDIDNRVLIGQTRMWNRTYAEFVINGTSRGENSLPLDNQVDLNNQSTLSSVSSMSSITISEGYSEIDVTGSGTLYPFYMAIDKASRSINDTYERMKWLTRSGSASTLFGLSGELFRGVTHELTITMTGGTAFSTGTTVSWGTGATAGTGQVLAVNTTNTSLWIQKLTGVDPTTSVSLTETANTATISAVTTRPISKPFVGASTGISIVGAYGVGYTNTSLSSSDKLIDLTGAQRQPPNLATGKVSGLDDLSTATVLVGLESSTTSGTFDTTQLSVASTTATTITVNENLSTITLPSSGTIRLSNGSVLERIVYSSVDTGTNTFTVSSVPTGINNTSTGFVSYIDYQGSGATSVQFQANYLANEALFVQVRYVGSRALKTFSSPVTFGTNGFDISALQIAD